MIREEKQVKNGVNSGNLFLNNQPKPIKNYKNAFEFNSILKDSVNKKSFEKQADEKNIKSKVFNTNNEQVSKGINLIEKKINNLKVKKTENINDVEKEDVKNAENINDVEKEDVKNAKNINDVEKEDVKKIGVNDTLNVVIPVVINNEIKDPTDAEKELVEKISSLINKISNILNEGNSIIGFETSKSNQILNNQTEKVEVKEITLEDIIKSLNLNDEETKLFQKLFSKIMNNKNITNEIEQVPQKNEEDITTKETNNSILPVNTDNTQKSFISKVDIFKAIRIMENNLSENNSPENVSELTKKIDTLMQMNDEVLKKVESEVELNVTEKIKLLLSSEGSKVKEKINNGEKIDEKPLLVSKNEIRPTEDKNQMNTIKTDEENIQKVEAKSPENDTKDNEKNSKNNKSEISDKVKPESVIKTESQQQNFDLKISGNVKTIETGIVEKNDKLPVLNKSEIINQVIERAKVTITPEKSEMILELKPEQLGKVSLKIATENGIITAKMVAESEQVKAILETNMQLLKDTLQKQGFNVQSVNVSVGQNSGNANKNAFENNNRNGNKDKDKDSKLSSSTGVRYQNNGLIENDVKNPYLKSESIINITA